MEKIESKTASDIIESRESKQIDSGSVCSPRFNNGGASGDSLLVSDSNLPKTNLVYRKGVSPSGVPDAPTPKRDLDSQKSFVCSRSGAIEDSFLTSDSNLPQANCNKIKELRIHFCDFGDMGGIQARFVDMLSQKFRVVLDPTNPQYVFYSVFGGEHFRYKECVKIFFTGENIVPNFNFCDYAIGFSYMDFGERYVRYPLYLFYEEDYQRALHKHENITQETLEKKKRFCSFVVSNDRGDPIRKEAFEKLCAYKRVDSGGRFLNNIGGRVRDKFAFAQECKFALCFENSSTPGYTTEKLIQAAAAQSVPIYWGDERVSDVSGGGALTIKHSYMLQVLRILRSFCVKWSA